MAWPAVETGSDDDAMVAVKAQPGEGCGRSGGQSLVELALSLPLLMMIIMGVIDLSFVLYAHAQVAAAAGQGARAGALFVGDLSQSLADNDAARAAAVRRVIYDPATGTTAMGLLRTGLPNFDVNSDVQVSYPNPVPLDPANVTRSGEEITVSVVYRQPLWFTFLPRAVSGAMSVSTTARMRIQ